MHLDILTPEQNELIPLVKSFGNKFYLVGGTALALQYGHRKSIDFDLFNENSFDSNEILSRVLAKHKVSKTFINSNNELTIEIKGVKFTWYTYSFKVERKALWIDVIAMPDPLHIAAMKAFALGRRAKWKDYVDLYFVFKEYSFEEVVALTTQIFGEGLFNERLFREQLAYFDDVNYSEQVEFMPGFEVSKHEIKEALTQLAVS